MVPTFTRVPYVMYPYVIDGFLLPRVIGPLIDEQSTTVLVLILTVKFSADGIH